MIFDYVSDYIAKVLFWFLLGKRRNNNLARISDKRYRLAPLLAYG